MATYKEIKGVTVQTKDSDPELNVGSWASGGAIPAGISSGMGFGTQTASVIGGGYNGSTYSNNVYEYDGTSWSSGGSLTASAGQARTGHGILTAGGAVAGYKTSGNAVIANYEQYDGTSFTEQADLNTARQTLSAAGSTTAALAVGGTTGVGPGPSQTGLTNVESYNGSSWTETTENNTGRKQATSFSGGPAPTMIFIGGASGSTFYANTETYNGSAWTETTDLNTARSSYGGAGQAQTDGLVFGGSVPSNTAATESWNGTTWTELNDLSTARNALVGSGTGAASALAAGGYSTAAETATEEFSFPPPTAAILTEGDLFLSGGTTLKGFGKAAGIPATTWASGGLQNSARARQAATGGNATISVAQLCGGYLPSSPPPNNYFTNTEQYNGSAWTEVNDLNTAKSSMSGFGTQTSAIVAGSPGGIPPQAQVDAWDGSSWAGTADLNNGRGEGTGAGLSGSAGIVAGGKIPTNNYQTHSETWDGTSWTETSNINTARSDLGAGGSQTSAVIFGGTPPPYDKCETWNGSSWTEVAELNEGRYGVQGGGISSSSALAAGGDDGSRVASTEFWNGTSWTELNDLSTARSHTQQCPGNAVSMVFSGGYPDSSASPAEEWEAEPVLSTVTVS